MAGSVIDSLVVTLGLDSKGFAQGIKGSAEELAGFTRKLAGMFLAVRGIDDVIGYFKDLNQQFSELGWNAMSLGVSAVQLRRLGEVAQQFGGQMGDAAASTQSLQDAVYGLRFNGQMSDQLTAMMRNNIGFMGPNGEPLDQKTVLEEIAKWSDQQAAMGMPLSERQWWARQMLPAGGGLATAAGEGSAALAQAFAQAAKDQKGTTQSMIDSQIALSRAFTSNVNRLDTTMGQLLQQLTPAIITLAHDVTDLEIDVGKKLLPFLQTWMPKFETDLRGVSTFLDRLRGGDGSKGGAGAPGAKGSTGAPWYERAMTGLGHALGAPGLEALGARLLPNWFGIGAATKEAMSGNWLGVGEIAASTKGGTNLAKLLLRGLGMRGLAEAMTGWEGLAAAEFLQLWTRNVPKLMTSGGTDFSPLLALQGAGGAFIPPSVVMGLTPPPTPTASRSPGGATAHWGPGGASGGWGAPTVNETTIGPITITAPAPNAQAIANSLESALRRTQVVTAAEGGQG